MENEYNQHAPQTIAELQSLVRESRSVAINRPGPPIDKHIPAVTRIALSAFHKIIEYQPEEYTITIEAGASVRKVQTVLAEKGQYLPFDPPFIQEDTTIGEMIANGYSGPGAYRYGILRDFILGLSFVDGLGNAIKTGGKVVKNAAGFDIPKLMVGNGDSLGIITEATFKVFPLPEAFHSIVFRFDDFPTGHQALLKLGRSRFTLDSLDLDQTGNLFVRLSGREVSMDQRVNAIETLLGRNSEAQSEESDPWPASVNLREFPDTGLLVKAPTTPTGIAILDTALAPYPATRRYSIGGFVSWIHWEAPVEGLFDILEAQGLSAQIVSGDADTRIIGDVYQKPFYDRIKQALDPEGKFNELYRRTEPVLPS